MRYARTVDGVNIAYQVRGDGPVDLVYTLGMAGNFEIEFEDEHELKGVPGEWRLYRLTADG